MSTVQTTNIKHAASASNNITLDASGNVGVGTATPAANSVTLTRASGFVWYLVQSGANNAYLGLDASSAYLGTLGAQPVQFQTSSLERMRIDASGNVGIGATSGLDRITARNDQNASTRIAVNNQDAGSSAEASLRLAVFGASWDISAGSIARNTNALTFGITGNERMRITSTGNVGIGTSSPGRRLDVVDASTAASSEIGSFGVGATSAQQIRMGYDTAGYGWVQAGNYGIVLTNLALNPGGGRVGIGTSTPDGGFRFHVNAGAQAGQIINTTGNADGLSLALNTAGTGGQAVYALPVRTAGTLRGGLQWDGTNLLYNNSSDYRLKANVAPMQGALNRISLLKPCTYTWIEQQAPGEGFIAHELAEVIPHAVTGEKDAVDEDGSIKPQAVDYSKIVVHLVAAMQELKAEIASLKARVAALENN